MPDKPQNNGESLYQPPVAEGVGDNNEPTVHVEDNSANPENAANDGASEKKGWSKKNKLLAILGITAAGIGAGVGGTLALGQDKDKPVKPSGGIAASASPSAMPSTEASPSPTENASELIPTVESLEVDKSLLSDPEELVRVFDEERMVEWKNAGATPENAQAAMAEGIDIPEFAAEIAAKYDDIYADALFVEGWRNKEDLIAMFDIIRQNHVNTLKLYFYTSFPEINPDDKEPYRYGIDTSIDDIVEEMSDHISLTKTDTLVDNSDMNRAGEDLTGNENNNGESGRKYVTYQIENDKIKISEYSVIGS